MRLAPVLYENVLVSAHPGSAIFSPNLAASDHPLDGLSPASDIQSLTLSKRFHDASGSGPARAQTAPSLGRGATHQLSRSRFSGRTMRLSSAPRRAVLSCRDGVSGLHPISAPVAALRPFAMLQPVAWYSPPSPARIAQVSVPLVDTCGRRRPPPASTSSPTPPHPVAGKARIRLASASRSVSMTAALGFAIM